MSHRELLLLSPHPLPTHHTLYLGDSEVTAFLDGHAVLWHPAVLSLGKGPPRVASPYDHEPPRAQAVYLVTEACSGLIADDWFDRAREAGCVVVRAEASSRADLLAELLNQVRQLPPEERPPDHLLDLNADRVAPFLGLGYGLLNIDGLFEAMSHDNLLARDDFWSEVTQSIAQLTSEDPEAFRRHLESAANHLLYAREVLYPSSVYLVDLCLIEEKNRSASWPASFDLGLPLNIFTTGATLEKLALEQPERTTLLREQVASDRVEICLGGYDEREDALLPLESQVWNLRRGLEAARAVVGTEPRVYARKRFGAHPHLPGLLQNMGLPRTTLFALDESVLPQHRSPVVNWPGWDGQQVEAFTRAPHPASSPQTFFHLCYILNQTMLQDVSATLSFLHSGEPASSAYVDLLELSRLGPVLGRWVSLSGYLNEVLASDYTAPSEADEFADNYLLERAPSLDVPEGSVAPQPASPTITGLAQHHRQRRAFDSVTTILALSHSLGLPLEAEGQPLVPWMTSLEENLERGRLDPAELDRFQQIVCSQLAQRLVSRGATRSGYLLLNPCGFTRRVIADLPGCTDLLPIEGAVKACQVFSEGARAVVEIPGFGFAWVPAQGQRGLEPNTKRLKLADDRAVRNEFFEAEIDPITGGLRAIRDHRTRTNRLAAQLVFQPGSTMQADRIEVLSTGPALGELASEGVLLDAQNQPLARFRIRFRAWIGRPMLEMHVDLEPLQAPVGYPWHSYFAARFASREERTPLIRGVCEVPSLGYHQRPETPDYLEWRSGQQNVVIFPNGMPFHQRQGNRMLDVLLIAPGETARRFELGIGLDRPSPMQTAQGVITPVLSVPTSQGPPHIGTTGWLFHLDAPNLLPTSLRPLPIEGEGRAIQVRLHEVGGHPGQADLRCVRNPLRARQIDGLGNPLLDLSVRDDTVSFDFGRHQLLQVEIALP